MSDIQINHFYQYLFLYSNYLYNENSAGMIYGICMIIPTPPVIPLFRTDD